MKKLFPNLNKTTVASILAILWSIGTISFFFVVAKGKLMCTETITTMLIQGMLGISMLILGAYYTKDNTNGKKEDASTKE